MIDSSIVCSFATCFDWLCSYGMNKTKTFFEYQHDHKFESFAIFHIFQDVTLTVGTLKSES